MKTYTRKEITKAIKDYIISKYADEQYLYEQFKTVIDNEIKATNKQELTPDLQKNKRIDFVKSIIKELPLISTALIDFRLSEDLVKEDTVELTLEEYDNLIISFSRERVLSLIDTMFELKKSKK